MKLFKLQQRTADTTKSFPFFFIFSLFLISSALGQDFAPKVDYVTGTQPVSVFAADLDGDGDFDLAVANGVSNTVSIFMNNGDGTFAAKVDYPTGSAPRPVFAADLDGDSDIDLAVANRVSNTVSILENNGDGTFAAKVDYPTGANPFFVFAADLDGDTDRDLAVANRFSHTVSVLENNGDGTFAAKVDYPTGTNPNSVFAADLDGDTDNDLAVTSGLSNTVSVFTNNGDGTFAAKVDYVTGTNPIWVFAADLDGDTDRDLAVVNLVGNTVSILKNNGDGTFAANVDYVAGTNPFSVFAADLDGDTDLDLAVANQMNHTVSVLKNNGDGTFAAKVDYGTGTNPIAVFAADLDGDTDNDLAVANAQGNTVSVLINSSAIGNKQAAINKLETLLLVDAGDRDLIDAIGYIHMSLGQGDPQAGMFGSEVVWGDYNHVDGCHEGYKGADAFQYGQEACNKLDAYLDNSENSGFGFEDEIESVRQFLAGAASKLAAVAIADAVSEAGEPDKIADAEELKAQGEEAQNLGGGAICDVALDKYGAAWEKAMASWCSFSGFPPSARLTLSNALPEQFVLAQNFPNPFNPATEISFQIPKAAHVKLELFNINGQKVAMLADDNFESGSHSITFVGSKWASGIYFYRLTAGEFVETKKMLLLK